MHVRDLVLGQGAVTSSSMIAKNFHSFHFAPIANFDFFKVYQSNRAIHRTIIV